MKLKITDVVYNVGATEEVTKVLHIYDFDIGATILSKITAKGGLLAGTDVGVLGELPVGSDGQVLSADSAEPTGMKWIAASDQGGATLTNKSGTDLTTGAVVIQYTSTESCFTTTTTAANKKVIGVAAEDIADNASGKVLIKGGVGTVMVTGTVAVGDKLCTSTTAGMARKSLIEEQAFATALTANASGNGTVTAILNFPELTYKLLGCDDVASGSSWGANYLCLQRRIAEKNGNLSEIRFKASGAGNAKVGIYSDNAGSVGTLIAVTSSVPVVAGFNLISFVDTPIVKGTAYWLAYNTDANIDVLYTTDACKYVSLPFANAFPSTPTGLSSSATYGLMIAGWG